jgi:hypothetical protein
MAGNSKSIKTLPEASEINPSDYLIVETQGGTFKIPFSNFVIDLDNTTFGSAIADIGSGTFDTAITVKNTSEPDTPVNGGTFYVQNGAFKYKGSSGTVTTIANA